MREIKFRAWDGNRMVDGQLFSISMQGQLWFDSGSSGVVGIDDYPLMQYTGLKDKSGKEIYEGDIVRYNMVDNEDICEVFWDAGTVKMKFKESEGWQGYSVNAEDVSKRVEVIGNIYEHGYLLDEA